jgi:MarR family transcriptional regulator, lower aerobic nicotinate degradation pathway regulator
MVNPMNYSLIKDLISLVEDFESLRKRPYTNDLKGFKQWIHDDMKKESQVIEEPDWEGKEKGRSPESVINTLIVHMNRYAKTYSKSAMHDSDFSTQDEFIYLINLKAFGEMTKMELIKKNIQEKPAGMQIINRLIQQGWVKQHDSETDKRSKIIRITSKGLKALEHQMDKIRQATRIVTGDLTYPEKMELIRLLLKLDHFHHSIFTKHVANADLLDVALNQHLHSKN